MATNGTGKVSFENWDESPAYGPDAPLPRIARVHTTNRYEGAIKGTGTATWVLSYGPDGSGVYRGYEQLDGALDGLTGRLVLEHTGEFDGEAVRTTWTIVPGSGAGDLAGVRGSGRFTATHGEPKAPYELEWEIAG